MTSIEVIGNLADSYRVKRGKQDRFDKPGKLGQAVSKPREL